ncbi:hypothetical protein CRG98_027856 [Punica granatum]|uniref:NAC domain-containing protein n=1 Tax=Punica granatum TaxID=22663 RepID=A0A2I0J6M1_PUNGR|nr:hypothetical protein CRG98_027856 [Punica granatum]
MPEEGWVVCRVFKKKNYQKALDGPRSASTAASMDSKIQMLCSAGNQAGVLDQILSYMGRTSCKVENETSLNPKHPERNYNNIVDNGNSNGNNNNNNKQYQFPPGDALHQERFMHLPGLDSPTMPPPPPISSSSSHFDQYQPFEELMLPEAEPAASSDAATPDNSEPLPGPVGLSDWAALDRLVASQLNGHDEQTEPARQFCCFGDDLHELHQVRLNRGNNNNQGLQMFGCESDFFWSGFTGKSSSSSSSSDPLRHLSV